MCYPYEDGHRFICASRLHLEVRAPPLLAHVALEDVGCACVESDVASGRLATPRRLLGALVLEGGGGEGGQTHHHQFVGRKAADVQRRIQLGVLRVLQLRGEVAVFLISRQKRNKKEKQTDRNEQSNER